MPEPLTPSDCDLRGFSYMPLDVGVLRDSEAAAVLNAEEFRAFILLLCACWHQVPAASIPTDDRALARLAGFGRDVEGWRAVKDGALCDFVLCSDGRLYHPVIAKKACESWEKKWTRPDRVAERSEHGRKAAVARWAARGSNAQAMPEDDARAMPEQCSDNALKGLEEMGEEGEQNKKDSGAIAVASASESWIDSVNNSSPATTRLTAQALAPEKFQEFWNAYPKRDGANPKEPARKLFLAATKAGEESEAIIASAKAYADEMRRKGQIETAYVAQAVTWLNQQRWRDYAPSPDDLSKRTETDQYMASVGFSWLEGKWQKREEIVA